MVLIERHDALIAIIRYSFHSANVCFVCSTCRDQLCTSIEKSGDSSDKDKTRAVQPLLSGMHIM